MARRRRDAFVHSYSPAWLALSLAQRPTVTRTRARPDARQTKPPRRARPPLRRSSDDRLDRPRGSPPRDHASAANADTANPAWPTRRRAARQGAHAHSTLERTIRTQLRQVRPNPEQAHQHSAESTTGFHNALTTRSPFNRAGRNSRPSVTQRMRPPTDVHAQHKILSLQI
jgi:hypothetical protein